MDWIEKLTGWSPDAGDGSTEAVIVFVFVIALVVVMVMRVPSLRAQLKSPFTAWKAR